MPVAVIADCHLGGPPGDPPERLLEQLRQLPQRGCERLVLLGDIFHYWVGHQRFETDDVRAVLLEIERLRRRGIRVDYIEGNRDFFIAGSPYAEAFDSVGTEVAFTAGGVRYLAVHGDRLNDRDLPYRMWRWLSKSPPVRFGIRFLPRGLAHWLMDSTEKNLAKTNFGHREKIPVDAITTFAEQRLGEGHDVLILGHFHRPRTWTVEGGEVRCLDAWFNSHRVEWLESCDQSP